MKGALSGDLETEIRRRLLDATERLVEYRGKDGFFGMAVPVPKAIEQEMRAKRTWHEGCPVAIGELSYLLLGFWGFDGKPQVGELVVHRKVAQATVRAFADLYALRFPIERMERIELYDGDDDRSMAANNTSAFNCRFVAARPGVFSNHSYGTAIDVNPVQNPYVVPHPAALKAMGWSGAEAKATFLEKLGYPKSSAIGSFCKKEMAKCRVSPAEGGEHLDRAHPGCIVEGPLLEAFTSRGFEWGGAWRNSADYQHIEVRPEKLGLK